MRTDRAARSPARLALAVQLVAAALTLTLLGLLKQIGGTPSALAAVAVQAALATALSIGLRQPRWWWLIHAGFVPAVGLAHSLALPGWVYLLALLLAWLLFGGIDRSRVPLYLSGRAALDTLEAALPERGQVLDIGAGTGTVLLRWSARRQLRAVGIEHAWLPWAITALRLRRRGSAATLLRGDWAALDLAPFDLVYAFLSPAAMPALWAQARQQMRAGSLLVSNRFEIPGVPPERSLAYGPRPDDRLLLWRMPGAEA